MILLLELVGWFIRWSVKGYYILSTSLSVGDQQFSERTSSRTHWTKWRLFVLAFHMKLKMSQ